MFVEPWSDVQSIIWFPEGIVGLFSINESAEEVVSFQFDFTLTSAPPAIPSNLDFKVAESILNMSE